MIRARSGAEGTDPNAATITLSPTAVGATKLIFTASSPNTTPGVRELPLAVYGVPTITATFDPAVVDTNVN